jgi:hypothetical protein
MSVEMICVWVSEDDDESMRSSFKTLIYDQQVYIVCVYRLPTFDHLYQKLLS